MINVTNPVVLFRKPDSINSVEEVIGILKSKGILFDCEYTKYGHTKNVTGEYNVPHREAFENYKFSYKLSMGDISKYLLDNMINKLFYSNDKELLIEFENGDITLTYEFELAWKPKSQLFILGFNHLSFKTNSCYGEICISKEDEFFLSHFLTIMNELKLLGWEYSSC